AVRETVEQRRADLGLELEDLPVDRGGRDIEPPRGFADRAGTAHGIEIEQGGGMDTQVLSHLGASFAPSRCHRTDCRSSPARTPPVTHWLRARHGRALP